MGLALLDREFESFAEAISTAPSFDPEVTDGREAARRHSEHLESWRASMRKNIGKLQLAFQLAENDPSGVALADLLGRIRPNVMSMMMEFRSHIATRPEEMDSKLNLVRSIGNAEATAAAEELNRIFNRAQRKHLKYIDEVITKLSDLFESVDNDEKAKTLTHEALTRYLVVNAYLAR